MLDSSGLPNMIVPVIKDKIKCGPKLTRSGKTPNSPASHLSFLLKNKAKAHKKCANMSTS